MADCLHLAYEAELSKHNALDFHSLILKGASVVHNIPGFGQALSDGVSLYLHR